MRGNTAYPKEILRYFKDYPPRSFMSDESRPLLFSLIRSMHPETVVEVGTLFAGTTEVMARALWQNRRGVLHTTDPFGAERCPAIIAAWPDELRKITHFYPMMSMDFYLELERQRVVIDLVLIDGNHDYEFALFDLQMAARLLRPGGIIVMDNVEQSGPFYAARDFVARHPAWTVLGNAIVSHDPLNPFDPTRASASRTAFVLLRSPAHLSVSAGPHSRRQMDTEISSLGGFSLDIPAQFAAGILYYLVTFRAFADGGSDVIEMKSRGDIRLDLDGEPTVVEHRLEQALRSDIRDAVRFTFEIDLSWQADPGSPPLALSAPPHPSKTNWRTLGRRSDRRALTGPRSQCPVAASGAARPMGRARPTALPTMAHQMPTSAANCRSQSEMQKTGTRDRRTTPARSLRLRVASSLQRPSVRSDNAEFATLKKVAFQRLAGHAQHTENRIRPLVDQVKLALAAAFAGRSVVME
jgi:predicted O-methyltransferase YrrM